MSGQMQARWRSILARHFRDKSVVTGIACALVLIAAIAGADRGHAQRLVVQVAAAKRTMAIGVPVGKTEDVRLDAAFSDINVGDPEVADVNPLTDRSLSILGKKIGTTRLTLYGEGKKLIGILDVEVTYDVSRLQTEIARVADPKIRVSSVNGRIMLSGSAPDAVTLDKAVTLARQFAPDIINSVTVSSPQQVMLEVRFIEVSRQASRELGVQWNAFGSKVQANIGNRQPAQNLPFPPLTSPNLLAAGETAAGVLGVTTPPFGVLLGRMIAGGITADVFVNALEERGLARSLAEPNLTTLSGDTASFLAGGEYPIPVAGNLGSITIEYKRYGVGLAFTPTVLKDGVINMKIEPEVSQFDPSRQVAIGNGISVPALIVRRASTTVELRDGQSFVIGGLLQDVGKSTIEQLPWLGDIPVLGSLFRSASYLKNETDLAIIVVPRLVRPARAGDPIQTPLDRTRPGNDADVFLMGKMEVPREKAELNARAPYVGHILDLRRSAANAEDAHVVAAKN